MPADLTVNATSPAGAMVSYTASATDETASTVTVDCKPASGSTFAMGDSTVQCTATDTDGDAKSGVQKSFNVHVNGAAEQLAELSGAVKSVGAGTSLANQVASVQAAMAAARTSDACSTLQAFINTVKAQTGKQIAAATATRLIADATRIRAVIGCTR